jgi:hypothetical protein
MGRLTMWMKVDDGLHAHRKTRRVLKSHADKARDSAPFGLWVLAGSWSSLVNRDGWIPEDELDRFDDDWPELAARLVAGGYWWAEDRNGEPGFGFNDWQEWNSPDGASASGSYGNHVRWHVNKAVVKADCEHCPKEPSATREEMDESSPRYRPDDRPDVGGGIAPNRLPVPEPIPATRPEPVPKTATSGRVVADDRPDVAAICERLADLIEANGSKRPAITAAWRDAARLMLDRDGRSIEEAMGAIEWSQQDPFWKGNILSMPTLRKQYDRLRLAANRPTATSHQQQKDDIFNRAAQRMIPGGI